jgi:LPXTG-site transpeptidase (sortase) family protein
VSEFPVEWPDAGVGSRAANLPRHEAAPKRLFATIGFWLDAMRKRPTGRRFLTGIVVLLVMSGLLMLSYPAITDIWAKQRQSTARKQFQALGPSGYTSTSFKEGAAVTRLKIRRLKVNVVVVYGWSGNALRAGAGVRPGGPLPGDPVGNVAIAGHRTGFGEPFRNLHRLKEGDEIELETPVGDFIYKVVAPFDGHANPWVTNPYDFTVIGPTSYGGLTLVTCDPPHTSKNRLIVRARLDSKA